MGRALPWVALLAVLAVLAPMSLSASSKLGCPDSCSCSLDRRGRRVVACHSGNGRDPIPLRGVDHTVEVLEFAPPPDQPNAYTIGPIFQQFNRLEELHIVRSNIPAIGHHTFWKVTTLQILNLTHNNITSLLDNNFRGLISLRELYLSDNRIESVPSATFRHLGELRTLSLARNRMKELVPRIFLRLGKLHEIDLSANPLLDLNTEVFKDVQELRVLRCRNCELSTMDPLLFDILRDLEVIDFGDNRIKFIKASIFSPVKRLREVWVDGNQLPVVVGGTFRNNSQLQQVNLARNVLSVVPYDAFMNVTSLRQLDLGYNRLERLDPSFLSPLTESLRGIVLSGNFLMEDNIGRILRVIPHITRLGLADMRLKSLSASVLNHAREVKILNISGNYLPSLSPAVLHPLPHLHLLDASRNQLMGLDEQTLVRLDGIEEVYLNGNPWACDRCHLPPLLSRVNRSTAGSPLRDLKCASPSGMKGLPLVSVSLSSLSWCSGGAGHGPDSPRSLLAADSQLGMIAAAAAVALLLIVGAAMLALVAYSRHHADYYYTQEDKRGPARAAIFENHAAVLDDRIDAKKTPKKVTIATIDELTKDPELHALTNGS